MRWSGNGCKFEKRCVGMLICLCIVTAGSALIGALLRVRVVSGRPCAWFGLRMAGIAWRMSLPGGDGLASLQGAENRLEAVQGGLDGDAVTGSKVVDLAMLDELVGPADADHGGLEAGLFEKF